MAIHAIRARRPDFFLIFEHKIDYALPLYLVLLLRAKPVFVFVHEMQQCATITWRSRILLNMCRTFVRFAPFYPVFIARDDAGLEPGSRFYAAKTLTIPHPHPLADQPALPRIPAGTRARLRLGIIETMRSEKPLRRLFRTLMRARARMDFDLVIGTALARQPMPAWLRECGVEIVDTTTEAQFGRFLQSLDIFVADYVRAEYYFRPSGAIVDAGMNSCFVICPDYPVFRAQIDIPVSIGASFADLEQLPAVLENSIATLKAGTVDFAAWREHHRIEKIAARFRDFLQERDLGAS